MLPVAQRPTLVEHSIHTIQQRPIEQARWSASSLTVQLQGCAHLHVALLQVAGTRLPEHRKLACLRPVVQGNGCTERFIRTLKENLLWVRTFDTVEELRQALLVFHEVYNTTWLIERHGFQTPAAVRPNQLSPAAPAA
jgi:hypothetical protein